MSASLARRPLLTAALALALPRQALAGQSGAELQVVYGANYQPFAFGEQQQVQGVQRDFVHAVLGEHMGLKLRHELFPWKRAQQFVREGHKDAFFTVPTADRAEYTVATALPFYETRFVMHTGRGNPKLPLLRQVRSLKDLEQLTELRHIHMLGSGWHEQHLRAMARVERVAHSNKIPAMLAAQRADVYVEQLSLFRFQARQSGVLDQIETLTDVVLAQARWHLFIGRSSPHVGLIPQIDQTLAQLKASGELDRLRTEIFGRYGIA